jgi:hypothetical protein
VDAHLVLHSEHAFEAFGRRSIVGGGHGNKGAWARQNSGGVITTPQWANKPANGPGVKSGRGLPLTPFHAKQIQENSFPDAKRAFFMNVFQGRGIFSLPC